MSERTQRHASAVVVHHSTVDRNLHRYWIRLAPDDEFRHEFGVTAFSEEDALAILARMVFAGQAMPDVLEVRADVDVRDLDQGHVTPNMGPPNWRGVWYPKGFDTDLI
jgi:hypothetical protein